MRILPILISASLLLAAICGQAEPARAQQAPAEGTGGPLAYNVEFDFATRSPLAPLLRSESNLVGQRSAGVRTVGQLQNRLQRDVDLFRRIFRSEGFHAAQIASRIQRRGNEYAVRISIDPGPQYLIGGVALQVNDDQSDAEVLESARPLIGIAEGAPARAEDIVDAEAVIERQLSERGFPFARVEDRDVAVDHANRRVLVTYFVHTGPKILLDSIQWQGLESVRRDYLDRFRTWQSGDAYTQEKIDQFRRRVVRTGLFRGVDISVGDEDAKPEAAPAERALIVNVTERPHRTFSVGGGYSTAEGFGGEVTWEHRNLLGRQELLQLNAVGAEIEQSLEGQLTKPNFLRLDQKLIFDARAGRTDTEAYNEIAGNVGVGLDRKLTEALAASIGLKFEGSRIKENDVARSFFIATLPIETRWDTTKSLFDPLHGARASLTIQPTRVAGDEDFSFVKFESRASAYYTPFDGNELTLAVRGRLGAMAAPNANRIPASRRFFAGGGGSIRGYGYQDVGPRDADGNPDGGRSVAEASLELRFRATETIGIVPFIDGGNVYRDRLPDFSGFRWGAGIGFRYFTEIVPIRFDVAFPLDKRTGDNSFQIYFSIGQSF